MDKFMEQKPVHTDELFQSTPSTEHAIEQSQINRIRKSMLPTIPRQPDISIKKTLLTSKRLIFIGKQILFALDTAVLGLISYQLFIHNLPYRILAWCLIALFWAFLASKSLRQRTLASIQKLLGRAIMTSIDKSDFQPTVNPYRNAQLRGLQDDTAAYLEALRTLHTQGKR
jgi:hypothetical protein